MLDANGATWRINDKRPKLVFTTRVRHDEQDAGKYQQEHFLTTNQGQHKCLREICCFRSLFPDLRMISLVASRSSRLLSFSDPSNTPSIHQLIRTKQTFEVG